MRLNTADLQRLLTEIVRNLGDQKVSIQQLTAMIAEKTGLSPDQAESVADVVVSYAEMYHESMQVKAVDGVMTLPFDMPFEE